MRPWPAGRVIERELLDDAPATEAARSLRDLDRINRLLGGCGVLRRRLHEVTSPGESLRVLDIGAGSGSMSRAVTSWFPRAVVVSLDYRLQHLASAPRLSVVADAFALPFTPRTFDIVFCSLFLHHFSDEGVTQLLQRFHAMAKRAVCVVDLHRSRVPYHFIPATAWLFRWHPITRHDGPASVLAAFSPIDLDRAAERAGFSDYSVCSHAPWFRLSLLARV